MNMSQVKPKPLYYEPVPGIGYSVERRPDGGMNITFTDDSHETLVHWREFALKHLFNSDRLTRNLYDLRQLEEVSEEAIRFAVEANSDPAARNIRLAVVVANESVANAIREIAALTNFPGGTEMKLFTDIDEAEAWLSRPLDLL
jgi:hypothetical protein